MFFEEAAPSLSFLEPEIEYDEYEADEEDVRISKAKKSSRVSLLVGIHYIYCLFRRKLGIESKSQ